MFRGKTVGKRFYAQKTKPTKGILPHFQRQCTWVTGLRNPKQGRAPQLLSPGWLIWAVSLKPAEMHLPKEAILMQSFCGESEDVHSFTRNC